MKSLKIQIEECITRRVLNYINAKHKYLEFNKISIWKRNITTVIEYYIPFRNIMMSIPYYENKIIIADQKLLQDKYILEMLKRLVPK